jgi:hypothetical protein
MGAKLQAFSEVLLRYLTEHPVYGWPEGLAERPAQSAIPAEMHDYTNAAAVVQLLDRISLGAGSG